MSYWSGVKTMLLLIDYTDTRELKKYREAISESGLNVNDCELLAVVDNKKERQVLSQQTIASFISEKDFNLIGQLKNQEVSQLIKRKYDLIVVVGNKPKRVSKLISKLTKRMALGINCTGTDYSVNLKTDAESPSHLINFAKNTLEKIN